MLLGSSSGTHTHQAAPHWTGSRVPATGHGVVLEPCSPKEVGLRVEFLGWAEITQQVPRSSRTSFIRTRNSKKESPYPGTCTRDERRTRERASVSENLAFSFAFLPSGSCQVVLPGTAYGVHLPGTCRGPPGTRDTALVCFPVSCTCRLELVQTLERMRRVQFSCPFLPGRGATK